MRDLHILYVTVQPEIEPLSLYDHIVPAGGGGAERGEGGGGLEKGTGMRECLLDCPAGEMDSCRDRQCCGGSVDPYIDIASFRYIGYFSSPPPRGSFKISLVGGSGDIEHFVDLFWVSRPK